MVTPWVEKYRPNNVDEMEQTPDLIKMFRNGAQSQNLGHYLFHGPPGTGKTSAILAMCKEIFGPQYRDRVIEFNASHDRGIDAVRKKIYKVETRRFVCKVNDQGHQVPGYKVIILDEADQMTDEAQDALRVIIESYSTVTRFCFICNYISKITDAIKSRCTSIYFGKLSPDRIISKLKWIAEQERMDLTQDIYDGIVTISDGNMRNAIMLLQNLKTMYDYSTLFKTPFDQLSYKELRVMTTFSDIKAPIITIEELHRISCTISVSKANEIIDRVRKCTSIGKVRDLTKEILDMGLPIDDVMTKIITGLIDQDVSNNLFTDLQKPLARVKDNADCYLQLLDFLTTIYMNI